MPEKISGLKDPYLSELVRGNEEVLARAADLDGLLIEEQLNWRPPSGGWTAGQALEHIVISGLLYINRIDEIIARARREGKTRDRPWKPSLMGGVIMRSVNPANGKKWPTQKVFTPGATPRPNVVKELIRMHERLERQMRSADGLDLRSVKITSPVNSLIRMNIGDAFGILVYHAQRHLLQAGRILSERTANR